MSSLLTLVSASGFLDMALKSAAVVLLAMVVAAVVRRTSAAWRHLVWCLSMASLLILPVLSLVLPGWRVAWLPQWTATPTQFVATGQAEPAQTNRTAPLNDAPLAEAAIVLPPSAAAFETEPRKLPQNVPHATIEMTSPPRFAMPWLAIVWLAGGLLSLVPLAIGLWQLLGLHRRSQVIDDHRWLTLLDELRRRLGVRRRVQLRQSESALAPLTWGALRPVLLVPFEASAWPDRRRRLVLLHELAHVRRWDWLTQLIAHVACAVYWFNPLVWLAARQMRIERERACDDIVLASGARPSDYARELLALATGLSDSQVSSLVAVPMARRGALHDRLQGILDSRRSRAALTKSAVCLGASLAVAVMAPLAMLRAAPPESAPSVTVESETVESEIFELETVEPKEEPPFVPVEKLEMTVNTSRVLTIGKRVPRVQVDNPDVVETTAASKSKIQVMAKKPGRTQINLFDEDDNVYAVDIIIYPDARELKLSSSKPSPMDTGPAGRRADQVDDAAPFALDDPKVDEVRDVTIEEALRTALSKSKVLRNMGGILLTPAAPQSNPNAASREAKASGDSKAIRGAKIRVVVARTRDDIPLADFESGVRNMVSDVERAYWDLYYNYRNLNAVQAGRDSALQTWREVHALYEEGAKGGEAEREAQAREQYFVFRSQVENTLGLLYTAESRLRYLMGLAPTDGRLIRPVDEPTTAEVRFDRNEVLREALRRGVELSQDKELELAHVLTNALRDLDRNCQVTRTTFNRRKAAAKQVEAVNATYEMGTATLDMLLDAQRRLADAEIAYYRALVDYHIAILQVHYCKGSLLEYDGIMLTEGHLGGDVSD